MNDQEVPQNMKREMLEKYLGNLKEYIYTGWMYRNESANAQNPIEWKCSWENEVYQLETLKQTGLPIFLTHCHCTTKIIWNCLIKHVPTGRLEFVGSTCMRHFDMHYRRCPGCFKRNTLDTSYCGKCRNFCEYHGIHHTDNAVHQATDFNLTPLSFGKWEGRTPESLVGIDDEYIHYLFGMGRLTQADRLTLVPLLPLTKVGFGRFPRKKLGWVKDKFPIYYASLKTNYRAFVQYL